MSQMVGKQIYIRKDQEEHLKKIAESVGIRSVEILRWALETERKRAGYRRAYTATFQLEK